MSLLAKKFKREHFPVPEADGLFVRPLKLSENQRMKSIEDEDKQSWFALGFAMTDETGVPLFTKSPEETDQQFADRVRIELDEADFDILTMNKTVRAFVKVSSYNPDTIVKN